MIKLYQSFWGSFSWGNVPLPSFCYIVLKWFTLFSLLIAPLALWVSGRLKSTSWKLVIAWLGLAMLIVWAITFIRGLPSLIGLYYIPPARDAYPVIIPTMMFLSGGWYVWLNRSHWLKFMLYLFIIGFIGLDLISILAIINFSRIL